MGRGTSSVTNLHHAQPATRSHGNGNHSQKSIGARQHLPPLRCSPAASTCHRLRRINNPQETMPTPGPSWPSAGPTARVLLPGPQKAREAPCRALPLSSPLAPPQKPAETLRGARGEPRAHVEGDAPTSRDPKTGEGVLGVVRVVGSVPRCVCGCRRVWFCPLVLDWVPEERSERCVRW